jgi:DNA invertase Pin-like site-specific DNA recombinase
MTKTETLATTTINSAVATIGADKAVLDVALTALANQYRAAKTTRAKAAITAAAAAVKKALGAPADYKAWRAPKKAA